MTMVRATVTNTPMICTVIYKKKSCPANEPCKSQSSESEPPYMKPILATVGAPRCGGEKVSDSGCVVQVVIED